MALDKIQMNLLKEVANLESIPEGAYNIRSNGKLEARNCTENIAVSYTHLTLPTTSRV